MSPEQTNINAKSSIFCITVSSLLAIFIVTACSLVTIAVFPGLDGKRRNLISFFVAFSVGCLLGDVVFHLLPEMDGINGNTATSLGISICFLVGVYLFFGMEKYLQTFHHGHKHSNRSAFCLETGKASDNPSSEYSRIPTGASAAQPPNTNSEGSFYALAGANMNSSLKYLQHTYTNEIQSSCATSECELCLESPLIYSVVAGDFLHNFIDGIAIGASFLASVRTGVTTTVAILFHEIPHELSDYAVLIGSGISGKKAFWYCFMSNLSAFIGIIPALLLGKNEMWRQFVLGFTAGVFLYVAMADLIPELLYKHSHSPKPSDQHGQVGTGGSKLPNQWKEALLQHSGIILGCTLMVSIRFIE